MQDDDSFLDYEDYLGIMQKAFEEAEKKKTLDDKIKKEKSRKVGGNSDVRVKSGIQGLDELIGGGFKKNSVIVVGGGVGNGKTTFSMQYIINGMLKFRELGLFISIDEEREPMYENMKSLGWDLEKLEREKKIVFIDYPAHEVDQFFSQENTVLGLIESMNIKRVAIDSAAPLALVYEKEDERRTNLLELMGKIRKWNCTTLITCEDNADASPKAPATRYGIESVADGFIYLHNILSGNERKRGIEIIKMRGTPHSQRIVPMLISKGGITVFPKKRF
ncbi:MAG: ATPase domain-containing protein [Candidatus Anstonellales archaeon]